MPEESELNAKFAEIVVSEKQLNFFVIIVYYRLIEHFIQFRRVSDGNITVLWIDIRGGGGNMFIQEWICCW